MAKTTNTKKKSTASKGSTKKKSSKATAREEVRTRQYQAVVRYGIGFFALRMNFDSFFFHQQRSAE